MSLCDVLASLCDRYKDVLVSLCDVLVSLCDRYKDVLVSLCNTGTRTCWCRRVTCSCRYVTGIRTCWCHWRLSCFISCSFASISHNLKNLTTTFLTMMYDTSVISHCSCCVLCSEADDNCVEDMLIFCSN